MTLVGILLFCWAIPSKTLCLGVFLFLQTLIDVESMKEIPVLDPKQHVSSKIAIASATACCSSVKQLYDTV